MNDKMKNLIVRTLSGIVMLGALLGCVLGSPWSFGALLLVVLVGGMIEFYALAARCGADPQRVVGIAAGAALLAIGFSAFTVLTGVWAGSGTLLLFCAIFLTAVLFAGFVCELFRSGRNPLANLGATVAGVLYVALPLALLPFVSVLAMKGWEPWVVIWFIFLIWSNDVFAYLVGSTCGRHKLCERISPKKSWEGFVGGVVGAVGMSLAAAWHLDMAPALWIGLAVVASITGVAGDLVESMFKRAAGVKDSGKAIPGHGGVLDRFDALLLAIPFVCIYLLIFRILI